jgi:hypothetical protein
MQLLRKLTNFVTTTALISEKRRCTRTRLRALSPTCDMSLNWVMVLAPEAGGFMELILLYLDGQAFRHDRFSFRDTSLGQ